MELEERKVIMKKIIPFKKDIIFKTHIAEVTSISLEHDLQIEEDSLITGEFIISGEYKISDTSTNTEVFNFHLPFDIHMDDHYDLSECKVDIYDFYYEIINDNILLVNIEVSVNNLKEKVVLEEVRKEVTNIFIDEKTEDDFVNINESEVIEKLSEVKDKNIESKEKDSSRSYMDDDSRKKVVEDIQIADKINSIFPDTVESNETYTTYKVYIIRENDTIEMIMQNYGITRDLLEQYNDLNEIKIGDKLIIPE